MRLINTAYHHSYPLPSPPLYYHSLDFKFACAKDLYLFLLDRANFAIETHSMHMFWNYYPQHRHEIGRLRNFCQSAKAEGNSFHPSLRSVILVLNNVIVMIDPSLSPFFRSISHCRLFSSHILLSFIFTHLIICRSFFIL